MKYQKRHPELPSIKKPIERKYQICISITEQQSNYIRKIRTEHYHDLVTFATLTASLLGEALLERQKTNNPPQ